jgi:hypothetical protein
MPSVGGSRAIRLWCTCSVLRATSSQIRLRALWSSRGHTLGYIRGRAQVAFRMGPRVVERKELVHRIKWSFETALMCTTSDWISASTSTNQGPQKGDLKLRWTGCGARAASWEGSHILFQSPDVPHELLDSSEYQYQSRTLKRPFCFGCGSRAESCVPPERDKTVFFSCRNLYHTSLDSGERLCRSRTPQKRFDPTLKAGGWVKSGCGARSASCVPP